MSTGAKDHQTRVGSWMSSRALVPLEEVVAEFLALEYHEGQVDKSGDPYIHHIIRVAASPLLHTSEQRQIAWLHDILEDTSCTVETLRKEGFSEAVIEGVQLMTHQPGEARREYIDRIRGNPDTLQVKMADNRDNFRRNKELPSGETRDRLYAKYTREWAWLTEEETA